MILDSHVHLGLPEHCSNKANPLINLCLSWENLIQQMNDANVDKAVALPVPHFDFDPQASNDYVLNASIKTNGRIIPFCRIDKNLKKNLENGFKGVKLHLGHEKGSNVSYDNIGFDDIKDILPTIENMGIPMIVHISFRNKLADIAKILEAAPNLKVILAHCGRGHIFTSENVLQNAAILKTKTNVYFETSTIEDPLHGNGEIVHSLLDILGEDRLLFGSDYPFYKETYSYKDQIDYLNRIDLPLAVKNKYAYLNAMRLLNSEKRKIVIRPSNSDDIKYVLDDFLPNLSAKDKKYLAFDSKYKYRNDWEKNIAGGRSCYIAEYEGSPVGYCRCFSDRKDTDLGDLWDFVVHPDYRKKGIATAMLQFLHRRYAKMFAKTDAKNVPMMNLLKKFGYTPDNPDAPRVIKWHRG